MKSEVYTSDFFCIYIFQRDVSNYEVTITGGEPLVRSDIGDILKAFKDINVKTTLVTNRSLIFRNLDMISKYVSRVNVSLHSMNPGLYQAITGTNKNAMFHVKEGLTKLNELYPKTSEMYVPINILASYLKDIGYVAKSIDERQTVFVKNSSTVYTTQIFCSYM